MRVAHKFLDVISSKYDDGMNKFLEICKDITLEIQKRGIFWLKGYKKESVLKKWLKLLWVQELVQNTSKNESLLKLVEMIFTIFWTYCGPKTGFFQGKILIFLSNHLFPVFTDY